MKKIISMLTSVVFAFSVVSSAVMADYTPTTGMPAVNTQLTNITFDDIADGTVLTNDSTNYISSEYTGTALTYPLAYTNGFTAVKDGTNTYVQGNALNSNLKFMNANVDALADVKSLGISFKVYINQNANNIRLSLSGSDRFTSPWLGDVTMFELQSVLWEGELTYQINAFGVEYKKIGRLALNDWTTIDVQYTCEESGDNFTLTLQKLIINDKEIAITPASKTTTKVAGRKNFQNLGSIAFASHGDPLTNVLKYDDINIYIPENSVSSVNPANESKIFADDEVSVEYAFAPSATDIEGISLAKHNGTAFETVDAATFSIRGNKAVLDGTLDKGAAYKLTVGDKTSIFTTFESYMPKAVAVKKAIFSNYTVGTGIDQPASVVYNSCLESREVTRTIFGNNTVLKATQDHTSKAGVQLASDANALWENVDSMVVSYEFNDETANDKSWGLTKVGLTSNKDYYDGDKANNGQAKMENAIFSITSKGSDATTTQFVALGQSMKLPSTITYTPGWHRVDLQLTKEGIAWARLDGTLIAENVEHSADVTSFNSMADWGILEVTMSNYGQSGKSVPARMEIDNIIAYLPENTVVATTPANESKIFADSEVAVKYVSAPSATDIAGIKLAKHNGTAFETVNAKFNVSGNKAVLDGTLEEGAAYKLTVGDKTSIFTTFESYMPKAATIKKAIFSNYNTTGTGIDQPYSKHKIFEATTVSKPIVGNSTVVIANTTGSESTNACYMKLEKDSATLWENADSMIVSYEYDDTTASSTWGYNGVGLVNDTTYTGIADGKFQLNNSIFAVSSAFNGKCDILGTKINLPTGYTKGWHKVDLQLTKEGIAWVRLDGTVIAEDVELSTLISSMAGWGNLQIGINNWSGGRPEGEPAKIVADNIIAYVPQKDDIEVANASYTYDADEKTVTITYDITENNKIQTVTVIGAAYGDNNRLTGVNKTTPTITAVGTALTGQTVTLENVTAAPNTVKLFVWDGFVNCVPLHDTIPVSKSE